MGRRGDDVRERDRIEVAAGDLARDQAGEMRHVNHQHRAGLIGDLAHQPEVDQPRVSRVPRDDDQRAELTRLHSQRVVVKQAGRRIQSVAVLVEHLAGDVVPEAVRQVTARVQ